MICRASYDSLTDIPALVITTEDGTTINLRDEFEQVKGKWQLKDSAIPGVGPLFNPALAANMEKAVTQAKNKGERVTELTEEVSTLKDKLAAIDSPGHKVLSKEDAETFDEYTALGTPKELKKMKSEFGTISAKVKDVELKDSMAAIATAGGIDLDVLADWAKSDEGITFLVKSVEQADAKGVKTTVDVPHVRIETKKDGKTLVEEKELLTFAKETLPGWKYDALTAVNGEKGKVSSAPKTTPTGPRVPVLGSVSSQPVKDTPSEKPIDKFQKQRDSRPSPFAKSVVAGLPVPGGAATGLVK